MDNVGEVVRSLTEAQRRGLSDAWRSVTGVWQVAETCEGNNLQALENAALINSALGLTPLGLAARASLIEGEIG